LSHFPSLCKLRMLDCADPEHFFRLNVRSGDDILGYHARNALSGTCRRFHCRFYVSYSAPDLQSGDEGYWQRICIGRFILVDGLYRNVRCLCRRICRHKSCHAAEYFQKPCCLLHSLSLLSAYSLIMAILSPAIARLVSCASLI